MKRALVAGLAAFAVAGCRPVKAPVAKVVVAGDRHPVGVLVALDGSASADPQGKPLAYRWRLTSQPSGSRANLAGSSLAEASLLPDAEGDYGLELVVSDGVFTTKAEATLTAKCGVAAPAIAMGAAPAARLGEPATLTATVTDPDAAAPCSLPEKLSTSWRLVAAPAGSRASLAGAAGLTPWFVPDVAGSYTAELDAMDEHGHASKATVDVPVSACGSNAPVIGELDATSASVGTPVRLSATASDPDAEAGCGPAGRLRFVWSLVGLPPGSAATLNDASDETPSFTPDVAGDYRVRLTVTSPNGRSATSEKTVTATACGGNAPRVTATFATPDSPALGQAVTLGATIADDDVDSCGDTQTFRSAWRFTSLPAGSRATLSDPSATTPWFTPDVAGEYDLELVVTDSSGLPSAPAELKVVAASCGGMALSLTSTAAAVPVVGEPFALPLAVTDPNVAECGLAASTSFAAAFASLPPGSLARLHAADTSSPWFTPDVPGAYVVELDATDSLGNAAPPVRVSLDVGACGAQPPTIASLVATPGAPSANEPVLLTATASDADDADGCGLNQALSHSWSFTSLPAGSRATMQNPSGAAASFVPDLAGSYGVLVEVTDSTGRRTSRATSVLVSACGLASPMPAPTVATASPLVGLPLVVSAAATDADTDAPCSMRESFRWAWSFDALPAGSRARFDDPTRPMPSFVPDVAGTYVVRLAATDGAGHTGSATVSVDVGDCGTHAPVVSARVPAGSVATGFPAALSATVTDADDSAGCSLGQTVDLAWSFDALPAGSRATLDVPSSASPSFTPDVAGAYVVRVVATDSTGRSSSAVATVTAGACGGATPDAAPTASPSTVAVGAGVSFDAHATDADVDSCGLDEALSYRWNFDVLPAGSRATLAAADGPTPSFVPDLAGRYVASVVVTSSNGRSSAPKSVGVTVAACGTNAPTATVATTPGSLAVGSVATLTPAVDDADGDEACQSLANPPAAQWFSYRWQLLSAPVSSRAALSSTTARAPELVPDVAGEYVVRLVVTDSTGRASAPIDTTLSVGACGANAPVATASASPGSPNVGAAVSLVGGESDADEGAACTGLLGAPPAATFSWRLVLSPAGSRARIDGSDRATASVVADLPGAYSAELTVTDATGRTSTALASFSAGSCGANAPAALPTASAGPYVLGDAIALDAHGHDADDDAPCSAGEALSYRWTLIEVPAGSRAKIDLPRAATPSFTPDVGGVYVLQVVVTDSTGRRSAPATVTVNVATTCGESAPVALAAMLAPSPLAATDDLEVDPLLACRFQLDATGSFDPDASCRPDQTSANLEYRWQQTVVPAGSLARLSGSDSATPWADVDAGGTYGYELWANDGTNWSRTPATVRLVAKGFGIQSVTPAVVCFGGLQSSLTLVATGQGFLVNAGVKPTVLFDGQPRTVSSVSGCGASGVTGVQSCQQLVFSIPLGLGLGDHAIVVTNPVAGGCAATATYTVGPTPSVNSIFPSTICSKDDPLQASNFTLSVQGSGFGQATQFTLGGAAALTSSATDSNDATALFPVPGPGSYQVKASNGTGCTSVGGPSVNVLAVPLVFFVDPPVLYDGINTEVTVYLSGLNGGTVTGVRIRASGSSGALLPLTFTYDATRPNQVQALVPKGLPAGRYDVLVTDGDSCTSIPVAALTVTGSTTLALASIDPPFGARSGTTAVDLRATDPAPAGKEQFATTGLPRVYLNPTGGAGVASALRTVTVVSPSLANAVVQSGLPAGSYDVIVVDPDGAVGVLPGGYSVVTVPPPVVDSITPGSIPSGGTVPVTVRGSGFSTTTAPTVSLQCLAGGVTTTLPAPVESGATSTKLVADVPASLLSAGTICVVRVTNEDGTYGDFSALGVTNSSDNLNPFAAASSMNVARRAPAVPVARATRSARFLYAIGGDDPSNDASTASTTVELAPLDRYGDLGAWRMFATLPQRMTMLAATTVGRYVYLAGGETLSASGNATISDTAVRFYVLDPAEAPEVDDLFLDFTNSSGLAPGFWYYRVAAKMSASDPDNPNGEGLPSDPLVVSIPAGLPRALSATIRWTAVPGAASYTVYRTRAANDPSGTEVALASVTTTSFTDQGTPPPAGAAAPHALGDIGSPVALPNLTHPRTGLGFTAAQDPSDQTRFYLYAVGGLEGASTVGATYEYLRVDVDGRGHQTFQNAWNEVAGNPLAAGRWQAGLWTVTDVETSRIAAGDTWLHVGAGLNAIGGFVTDFEAARVQAGGLLTTFASDGTNGAKVSGYGYAAAADQLFSFGGAGSNGVASATIDAGQLCGTGGPCTGPPGLQNWNNNGSGLSTARYLPGTAVESARIFVVGGEGLGGAATSSVESVIW